MKQSEVTQMFDDGESVTRRVRGRRAVAWRRRVGRRAALLWCICAAITFFVSSAPSGLTVYADTTAGFRLIGRMPFGQLASPALYTLTVDSALARGYLVLPGTAATPARVRVFDLNTRHVIGEVASDSSVELGQGQDQRPDAVVDSARGRVFFYVNNPPPTLSSCSGKGIDVLNERTLAFSLLPIPCDPTIGGIVVTGMAYDPQSNSLFLVGASLAAESPVLPDAPVPHAILQLDPTTGRLISSVDLDCDVADSFVWPVDYAMIGRSGHSVTAVCQKTSPRLSGAVGSTEYNVLVQAPLDQTGKLGGTPVDLREIGVSFGSFFDPAAGLAVIPSTDAPYDLGSYILDASTGLFRGFIPTSNDQSNTGTSAIRAVGIDPSVGRLYMQTAEGLIVSDYRNFPVPVGLSYSAFRDTASDSSAPPRLIASDPAHSRVFVPDLGGSAPGFDVLVDNTPPIGRPTSTDPDTATNDLAEGAGSTSATFSGSADAFGASFISEGGVNRVLESRLGSCGPNFQTDVQQIDSLLDCPYNAVDSPGDRDWFFGHSAQAALTNVGTSASGSSLDATDSATAADFQSKDGYGASVTPPSTSASPSSTPSPVNVPRSAPIDRPQDRLECDGSGGQSTSTSAGSVTVNCTAGSSAQVKSVFDPSSGMWAMQYGSSVSIGGGLYQGIQVTSKAWAKHIDFPSSGTPLVYIREIDTAATTAAHGRPGTAAGSFSRKIYGFTSPSYSCSDDDKAHLCDAQRVGDAITAVLEAAGLDAQALAPQPDRTYLKGTPGGYQAVVTKDAGLYAHDKTVNDDSSDTVAGLAIVFYDDGSAGRTREILQFAGVHAESHYGIYALSSDSGTFGDSGGPGGSVGPNTGTVWPATGPVTIVHQVVVQPTPKPNPIVVVIHRIATAIQEGWRLLVSDPKTAAMLAGVWGLLVLPVYLALRRRSLLTKVARGVA